ncbi:hypothetical protein [Nocardia sp. NPDC003963]
MTSWKIRMGINAVTGAAIVATSLGAVAVQAGSAAASGAGEGNGSCLATQSFDMGNHNLFVCVAGTREECTAWVTNMAAAVGGRAVDGTCAHVEQGQGGWAHPAGFYGSVQRSK